MTDLRYNIQIEVVTPLSVGAGIQNDWVKGVDFVQKNNKLYVLDLNKMMSCGLEIEKISQCFINQDEDGICQLLGNHIEEISKYVYDLPVKTDNPIKTFLRTQMFDRPLIPGSSIKGSVRSALFNFLRDNNEKSNDVVFGKMKTGDDFMRFIKIGDVEMKKTILANTKLFNLHTDEFNDWTGGWKRGFKNTSDKFQATGFNTLYECVPPKEKGLGTVIMAAAAFQQLLSKIGNATPHAGKKKKLMEDGIHGLFKVINQVTKNYLRKERGFFTQYDAERSDEIVECIDDLISMIPDDNKSCLMKMSAGVGFHSITGDWQFDSYTNTGFSHDGKKKYKSRKIAEYEGKLMLMGFVKLSVLQKDYAEEQIKAIDKDHQKLLEDIRTSQQRKADMLKRIEQEREAKIEQERKQQQLQNEYDELISQANDLYFDNKYREAHEKVMKAESLLPECTNHKELLEKIEKFIKIEEAQQKDDEEKRKKLSQPLSTLLKGKTSIGNIMGHLGKWLKVETNSFGEEEALALADAFHQLPNKEAKKLKGIQKRIASIIGDENASSVFAKLEEINNTSN